MTRQGASSGLLDTTSWVLALHKPQLPAQLQTAFHVMQNIVLHPTGTASSKKSALTSLRWPTSRNLAHELASAPGVSSSGK